MNEQPRSFTALDEKGYANKLWKQIMRYDNSELITVWKKTTNNKHKKDYFEEKYNQYTDIQQQGSVHTVDNKKVFGSNETDDILIEKKYRPGAVYTPPDKATNYETEWIPFSSKLNNRNPDEVVFLEKDSSGMHKDCVALLEERRWFKCFTLGERKSKLPYEKVLEIIKKIEGIKDEE